MRIVWGLDGWGTVVMMYGGEPFFDRMIFIHV